MTVEQRGTRAQNLILENRKRLSVSGVEEVDGFDEEYVRMITSLGTLTIHGAEMHVESLSVESGEAVVTGHITELVYEESSHSVGIVRRLFRGNGKPD